MIEPRRMRREGRSPGAASDDRDPPLRHARSLPRIALLFFLTACHGLPQAVTSPIVSTVDVPALEPVTSTRHRWNVHDAESRIDIESGELWATFRSSVPRFRGFIGGKPERLTIDFDLRSLVSETRVSAAIIQEDYLEVDTYPVAHLDVVLRDASANGILELHGVRRNIRFPITIERTPGKVRIRSAFTLKRHDFGIVNLAGPDWMARENIAVGFDLVAAPERVTVEEID
jgi:polyisoprenoid-binding protein YceI